MQTFLYDVLYTGDQQFVAQGDTATVFLGDQQNFLRATNNGPTQLGSFNDIVFNKNQFTVNQELMRIKVTGDVGIGTSAPTAKLDVRGVVAFGVSARLVFTEGDLVSTTDNDLKVYTTYGRNLLLQTAGGGRVGIGVQAPLATLHLDGAIALSTEALPAGTHLRAKLEGEVTNSEVFATVSVFALAGENEGALRVVNSDGRGIVRCTGTNTAGQGKPGVVALQAANGELNNLLADDNGRLFLARSAIPTEHILLDSRPEYRDEFWELDPLAWEAGGSGAWVAEPSSDTAVGPSALDLCRGGFIHLQTGGLDTDSVTLFGLRPCVSPLQARFRCRFFAETINLAGNNLVVELGLKREGKWLTRGGRGYYFSFDTARWSSDAFFIVHESAQGFTEAAVPPTGVTSLKFYEMEFSVEKTPSDVVVVKAWQNPNYVATMLTIPPEEEPLLQNLVPGFAIYNVLGSPQSIYVDLIEYETLRANQ